MTQKVLLYDTTLRDGAQAEEISFSLEDKLKILVALDEFGIDYVEGGWPESNPKDSAFFKRAREIDLMHTRLAAFGSTRRRSNEAENDPNLQALIKAETPVVTIFGKSSPLHVTEVLRCTLEENLKMVAESVAFLKGHRREVLFDAEHFYDAYNEDPVYAKAVLAAAAEAGADCLVLCDTNGGMLPGRFREITEDVVRSLDCSIGVHVHNDSGVAVANSLESVQSGVVHIQGTCGGIGERCGNANLFTIIPNLVLKMHRPLSITREKLKELSHVARYVSTVANHHFSENSPYVGSRAFAHKGGMHVDSVVKKEESYEHVPPEAVGNDRRFLVSELAGRSNILHLARHEGIELKDQREVLARVVQEIKQLENKGYQFEGAEASAALVIKRVLNDLPIAFDLVGFRVIVERRKFDHVPISEATVKVSVDGHEELSVGEGDGPVAALDAAFRSALKRFYPEVSAVRLTDYRVRVIDEDNGSSAKVRVVIDSADNEGSWGTVGVSENIIEASWSALVDSIIYGLIRHGVIHRFHNTD